MLRPGGLAPEVLKSSAPPLKNPQQLHRESTGSDVSPHFPWPPLQHGHRAEATGGIGGSDSINARRQCSGVGRAAEAGAEAAGR